ncbi:MAG: hypothetical protein ACHQ1H_00555, partial [Nitrososphaerales archaeon]
MNFVQMQQAGGTERELATGHFIYKWSNDDLRPTKIWDVSITGEYFKTKPGDPEGKSHGIVTNALKSRRRLPVEPTSIFLGVAGPEDFDHELWSYMRTQKLAYGTYTLPGYHGSRQVLMTMGQGEFEHYASIHSFDIERMKTAIKRQHEEHVSSESDEDTVR